MNRRSVLAVLLIAAVALALRLPQLGVRPLHPDEAVNAFKVTELWQEGRYVYDPDEYHGPTLHYFTVPFLWFSGAEHPHQLPDATLRWGALAFGTGLVLLSLLFGSGLGRNATLCAALLTAISPAMVFYSRYFIHEMLLVFFTALTLGSAWRYSQTRAPRWAVLTGAGLGLMAATKETFVLALAAMVLAGLITAGRSVPVRNWPQALAAHWNGWHFALALGTAAVIWIVLFTSFFTNARGPLDSLLTYLPWLKRAGGESPHIHPWHFYLHRLAWFHPARGPVWSEGLILGLALVGGLVSLVKNRSPLRHFLALYTLILTAIYCAISYKTPWCLLGFFYGMILLAGIGAAALFEVFRRRSLQMGVAVFLFAAAGQLAWQAARANFVLQPDAENPKSWRSHFKYAADPRNPYVYAQTSPDILSLMQRVDGIARVAPTGYATVIKVIAPGGDYWPVPWHLRRFEHVGWYDKMPEDPFAPVMLVSAQLNARLDETSERKWIMAGMHALRPGRFLELYVELELWKQYVATLPRPTDD